MLRSLVAFPVGFATERFGTTGEGAAVRSFMAFLVFSMKRVRLEQPLGEGWNGNLLHLAAEPGPLRANIALEPVLFIITWFWHSGYVVGEPLQSYR